jgi:uncharacterized protein YbjT (DUF2867 family)
VKDEIMKVFVAGATGQTGRRVVQQLVERQIAVKALVRDRDRATSILPASVELVIGDVANPGSFREAIADCTIVICATGASPSLNPFGPFGVDYIGTKNLVDVAKQQQIEQFVLVSSLCVSNFFHPLNLFWLILVWKRQAEEYLQQSGLNYTIVRPGGLLNSEERSPLVMAGADRLFEGRIPRSQVAQVCIEALFEPAAKNKVVEIVTQENAAEKPFPDLFASV